MTYEPSSQRRAAPTRKLEYGQYATDLAAIHFSESCETSDSVKLCFIDVVMMKEEREGKKEKGRRRRRERSLGRE